VEGDLDLALLPLVQLVGALVPDRHRARAVLPLGDLAVELEVLERVILGVHGQPVVRRGGRDAVGDGPGGQHAVVLEAQVPVQAGGVVLLDDEAAAGGRWGRLAGRLGGGFEVTLGPIALERALVLGSRHGD
jgi:hypothetical protein